MSTRSKRLCFFFFFNDTATTEIYTLSLHDALPIFACGAKSLSLQGLRQRDAPWFLWPGGGCYCTWVRAASMPFRASADARSEEHTSELQSRQYLVCRLLLEKKNDTMLPFTAAGALC